MVDRDAWRPIPPGRIRRLGRPFGNCESQKNGPGFIRRGHQCHPKGRGGLDWSDGSSLVGRCCSYCAVWPCAKEVVWMRRSMARRGSRKQAWCHHSALAASESTRGVMTPELPNEECKKAGTRMKKIIASVSLSLALMSSAAIANDRAGNSMSGALSKIGHAAHTLVAHIAKPFTARSRSSSRSSATQQAQRASGAGPSSHVSDSPPAPRSQIVVPTAAPSTPSSASASTLPPVQPLE
jgi:hypothetical protein